MRNFQELIKERSIKMNQNNKSSFNTNDFLLEVLLDQEIDRNDMINLIIERRLKMLGYTEESLNKMKSDELDSLIQKLYKTSKNGLDTSVSDSNNNSSFSYNEKYDQYELIKKGSKLKIVLKDQDEK